MRLCLRKQKQEKKKYFKAVNKAQRVRVPATELDDPSLTPGTCMAEGKKLLHRLFSDLHTHAMVCMAYAHKRKKIK